MTVISERYMHNLSKNMSDVFSNKNGAILSFAGRIHQLPKSFRRPVIVTYAINR